VKWFLAIPNFIVLMFLWIAATVILIIACSPSFTGRRPRGMCDFLEGVVRRGQRVIAYAFLLVTDRYPPSRLAP
jgi:hypothetical protein